MAVGAEVFPVRAEIVACTMGTRGDILPFLSLCAPFVERGHKVTILTNRNWRPLVEEIGAEFGEIAEADPSQSGRDDQKFYRSSVFPSFGRSFSWIETKIAGNPRCVIVYRTNMLGAQCAAEKFGIPSVEVALQPSAIWSSERPPWPFTSWVCGRFAGFMKRIVMPAIAKLGELTGEYRRFTKGFRRDIGLPSGWRARKGRADLLLVLCPDWFAMPQKDWPGTARTAGFLYFDGSQVDEELDAFIAAHGPPVTFTPGTGVTDIDAFFSVAAQVCERLALPGVFVSSSLKDESVSGAILVRKYTELHRLIPRSRLLVHHGGIGSVAQAIRAGVPQIVLPGRFDQPDNALRVAILGLGGAIFSKKPTAQEVEQIARKLLSSPLIQRQVKKGAQLIRAHPSNELAYEMICRVIDRHFGSAPYMSAI